ncbi:MAG: hypothetical protein JXR63_07075 [Spirochaetales bacterium]|nr:hypothetical protein [Spirochaetales bacterium]
MKRREKKEKRVKDKKVITEEHLRQRKKRKKRFLAFFNIILLLTVGFLIFFFGWIKPDVEPGDCVVIFSKTSGFESEIYEPGKFRWMWQGIIPKNIKYYKYKIVQREFHLEKQSQLPSGEIYSSILTSKPDFSYKVDIRIRYRLNKEMLVDLVREKNGDVAEIDKIYAEFEQIIESSIPNFLQNKSSDTEYLQIISRGLSELAPMIEQHIATLANSQYFLIDSVIPIAINFPDLELYLQAKETYLKVIKVTPEQAVENMQEYANYRIMKDTQIEGMAQLGKLLQEYPVLLDYLKIYSASERDFELLNPLLKN